MRLIEVVIVKHHSTCSLNPFQNKITALLKCQYLESVRGGWCGEVRGWSQRGSGRGGERERERGGAFGLSLFIFSPETRRS